MFSSVVRATFAAVTIIGLSGFSSAEAKEPAFVSKVGGKGVTLLSGGRKSPVHVQTLLASGDKVTAARGSFVEVTYLEDGCIVRVSNGRSITISDTSPCTAAETAAEEEKPATETEAPEAASDEPEPDIAPAATEDVPVEVTDVKGTLARANMGEGLVEIKVGTMLKKGDAVFAGQNSTVTLYFVDPKCYYTLQPETYFEITGDPPCRRAAS